MLFRSRPEGAEPLTPAQSREQANAALALWGFGQGQKTWPLLKSGVDPTLRSQLVHLIAPAGVDPTVLIDRLGAEQDPTVRQAILLAIDRPNAVGQAYNVTDPRCVTKQEFFETICKLTRLPRPLLTYPMWLARFLCRSFEGVARVTGIPPLLNSAKLKFMGLNLDYSIEKARRELGYNPSTTFEEGIRRTIDWLRQEGRVRK